MNSNSIEKQITLHAPLAKVWDAVSDSSQFGAWFGMKIDGPFVAGQATRGSIAPTQVNNEVAAMQKPHEGTAFEILIEKIEPQHLFSFRWHPFAVDKSVDYSSEPTTLIEFRLKETSEGVLLTITESGFDQIPLERRAQAFSANEQGWAIQATLIEAYLARTA